MRIAIVNDTLMIVEVLRRIVVNISEYKLIWIASNGMEAVENCTLDTPDLILMDIVMPGMDGVEATRQIMKQCPCAILMVTVSIEKYAAKVFQAMGYGALDAVNTPVFSQEQKDITSSLHKKIATIARLIDKSSHRRSPPIAESTNSHQGKPLPPLIAIGASTGGPQALLTILSQFPPDINAAVAIIQHIDAEFAPDFAKWLNQQIAIPVELATPGCFPEAGKIIVAGTNNHLVINPNLSFAYQSQHQDCIYHPSIDVFFKSLASYWQGRGIGVILTGMGRDGAAGLKAMRDKGWHTIAQNHQTCIVYGMPKAAIELKAAVEVLPIETIASQIIQQLKLI